ncbi:MAG: MATE family efflux transporter [Dehalococcoidia bacterium]|nr:MATE family efflux transporter [Dehalococcoidia bacterium]
MGKRKADEIRTSEEERVYTTGAGEVSAPGGRPATPARDWTKGSVIRNLLTLSWPIVIHNALYMVGQTVDMIWIGRLGSNAVAGVGVAFIIHMLILSAMMGFVTGTRAMVARAVGAGDNTTANHIVRQALIVSVIIGVIVTVLGVTLAEPILGFFGLKEAVVIEGVAYMQVLFGGWVAYSMWLVAFSIMQAAGDSLTPMVIHAFTRSVQLVLSPLLVFGLLVFPQMGVRGAALSMIIGQALGMVISLWILAIGRTRLKLTFSNFRLDLKMIWRMVKIGAPAMIMGMERNFGQMLLLRVISPFGTLAVAAHTLNQRVEMFVFMPGVGIGTGAGVLVGQNLGARQAGRAETTGWLATGLSAGFMSVCAVAVLLWAEPIMSIFTREAGLIEMGGMFLRIGATGYLLNGLSTGLQNSISGAGDTLPPMLVSIAATWVVLLPLAVFLPKITDLGVQGVRWAMVASLLVGAVAYSIYFKTGRWKRKAV